MHIKPHMPVTLEKELLQLGVAFSHTTRIHIIEALTPGPKSVHDLQNIVRKIQKGLGTTKRIRQPALSQHLKILRENEIVSARQRGTEVMYNLHIEMLTRNIRHILLRLNMHSEHPQ
jgi:DNA-binding transcriptional ArsR family regulator